MPLSLHRHVNDCHFDIKEYFLKKTLCTRVFCPHLWIGLVSFHNRTYPNLSRRSWIPFINWLLVGAYHLNMVISHFFSSWCEIAIKHLCTFCHKTLGPIFFQEKHLWMFFSLLFFLSQVAKSHHRKKKLFFLSIEPMLGGSSFLREPLVQVLTPKIIWLVFWV